MILIEPASTFDYWRAKWLKGEVKRVDCVIGGNNPHVQIITNE